MSLKIYLLRHGETTYSQRGAYCGELDAELTPEGRQMVKHFAQAYRSIPWTEVYVSPMKRAIATAQPLCEALGLTMQIRDGLREISYDAWEGQRPDFVRQHYNQDFLRWQTDPAWNPPTGGETAIQIADRALSVIKEINGQQWHLALDTSHTGQDCILPRDREKPFDGTSYPLGRRTVAVFEARG